MRLFFGIFLASTTNFFLGILGFYITKISFINSKAPTDFQSNLTVGSYVYSFFFKFLVILILTWIMHRVITMLDSPKKRILFIFTFSYCRVYWFIFWVKACCFLFKQIYSSYSLYYFIYNGYFNGIKGVFINV